MRRWDESPQDVVDCAWIGIDLAVIAMPCRSCNCTLAMQCKVGSMVSQVHGILATPTTQSLRVVIQDVVVRIFSRET